MSAKSRARSFDEMRSDLARVASEEELKHYDNAVESGMKITALKILKRHSIPFYDPS
jgi:hypothetical protein